MDCVKVKNEKNAVDVFKLVCAVMVIAIHTKPFADNFWLDAAVGMCTRFAVPFFFFSSAYFLFSKLAITEKSAQSGVFTRYFLRLLRFYTVWYIIVNLINVLISSRLDSPLYYIKQFIFCTNGSPLWFVNALLWGSAIVFFLHKLIKAKIIFFVSLAMLLIGYAMSTIYTIISDIPYAVWLHDCIISFIGTQNGLFFTFPYVALALLTSENSKWMSSAADNKRLHDFIYSLIFFVLLGVEAFIAVFVFNAPLTFLWLSALPMTYFVFRLLYSIELPQNPFYYRLRKVTTLIYVVQIPLMNVFRILLADKSITDTHNLIYFFSTLILSALVSVAFVALSERKPFTFLKILY